MAMSAFVLIGGILFTALGVLWVRENWGRPDWVRGGQASHAALSLWGHRFGRSAFRSIAVTVLFFGPVLTLLGAGGVLTELAAPTDPVNNLGVWLTAAGVLGVVTWLVLAATTFLIGRPYGLLPTGLREQPGFLWDRGSARHRARLTEVQPPDGLTYYLADCECGWMDVPHDSRTAALKVARDHTPNVSRRLRRTP